MTTTTFKTFKTITLTSNGFTGEEWIRYFEDKKYQVSSYAKELLRSPDFKPTKGKKYKIVIIKGEEFNDEDRITKTIRAEAHKRGLIAPPVEVACLMRKYISDKKIEAMGLLYVVAMHEPINDSVGRPDLLGANRGGGGRWLNAYYDYPGIGWYRGSGFAFAVSQVSPLSSDLEPVPLSLDLAIAEVKKAGYQVSKIL
jgi:hypothetical protein